MTPFNEHISMSFERLSSDIYDIDHVWQKETYDWYGDWEGRALLAFCCLYQVSGKKIDCMEKFIAQFPYKVNEKGYLGCLYDGWFADEQQLAGHSWLLRGLLKYYRLFNDKNSLSYAKRIIENLYLPIIEKIEYYPTVRQREEKGGVSGNSDKKINGWKISTDIGCLFISLDGLSDYYAATKDEKVKTLIDKLINVFVSINWADLGFQTHATLTAVRGIISTYKTTGDKEYLTKAEKIFDFYTKNGMTLTYENYNWFGRPDTWTEPCAVVDSLIISLELYRISGNVRYGTLAKRIWFNGLQFCHRANGGAGPNSCVTESQPVLSVALYEAYFCCTMRYNEALVYVNQNYDFLYDETDEITEDDYGRKFVGNRLLCEDTENVFTESKRYNIGGKEYIEIPSFCDGKGKLKII